MAQPRSIEILSIKINPKQYSRKIIINREAGGIKIGMGWKGVKRNKKVR